MWAGLGCSPTLQWNLRATPDLKTVVLLILVGRAGALEEPSPGVVAEKYSHGLDPGSQEGSRAVNELRVLSVHPT